MLHTECVTSKTFTEEQTMRPVFSDQDKLRTAESIRKISDAPAYEIVYHGGYAMEKYLSVGALCLDGIKRFWRDELLEGHDPDSLLPHRGCSGFTSRTPEGHVLLCHDFDTPNGAASVLLAENAVTGRTVGLQNMKRVGWGEFDDLTKYETEAAALAVCAPYLLEDGMNSFGFAVVTSSAWGSDTGGLKGRTGLYGNSFARAMLDSCKDTDEAVEFFKKYVVTPQEAQVHFMLCDAAGKSLVAEYTGGELRLCEPEDRFQICSNFILYNNPSHRGKGEDRYAAYEKALSACGGIITAEDAMALLWENHIENEACFSAVFDLTDRLAMIRFSDGSSRIHKYIINR